jgi:hypothetical protein
MSIKPNPELAIALNRMRNDLLIVFLNRIGGTLELHASEIDRAGSFVMTMEINPETRVFRFTTVKKVDIEKNVGPEKTGPSS